MNEIMQLKKNLHDLLEKNKDEIPSRFLLECQRLVNTDDPKTISEHIAAEIDLGNDWASSRLEGFRFAIKERNFFESFPCLETPNGTALSLDDVETIREVLDNMNYLLRL